MNLKLELSYVQKALPDLMKSDFNQISLSFIKFYRMRVLFDLNANQKKKIK